MFRACSSLKPINLSNFDTSNVENMDYMFYNCQNIDDIYYMFSFCSKLRFINYSSFKNIDISLIGAFNNISTNGLIIVNYNLFQKINEALYRYGWNITPIYN
jgi:surface protein